MVTVAHGQVARVKELVGRHQTLAKATYDWGFGDWESALGAASHVGNREIAEFLSGERGPAVNLFSRDARSARRGQGVRDRVAGRHSGSRARTASRSFVTRWQAGRRPGRYSTTSSSSAERTIGFRRSH